MNEINFLKAEHFLGDSTLDIFKKYGLKATITDFSILLGGFVDENNFINDQHLLENRTGYYYTGTFDKNAPETINSKGHLSHYYISKTDYYGARPAVYHFDFAYQAAFLHQPIPKIDRNGITIIEYGEFPQTIVNNQLAQELDKEFRENLFHNNAIVSSSNNSNSKLKETGKEYIFDNCYFPSRKFSQEIVNEYEYMGKKYVCVRTIANIDPFTLSNGTKITQPEYLWFNVEPIIWLVDDKTNTIITEKIIFAGVPFNSKDKIKNKFKNNTIGEYINKRFINSIKPSFIPLTNINKEYENNTILPNEIKIEEKKEINDERELATNFDFSYVSDEDIIRGTIESNIAVFLHGKSSEGKSARVKQIDPDCEIVYLRNATPDSLNGKSVYNAKKGEMIDVPPTWYKKIKEKCEKEPDKLHILFFDELTNALPSIQGMAFNIILDKEVNGIWKLPDNCRIVAAGNDLDDSLAANEMAEPLFNRFSHVYIETTVEKWLKWAAKKENHIHPAIYAYIAYKSCSRSDVLRTTYDGKHPNADPRKWEMASKVLYATKNPEMLRSLIGEKLTADFIQFCKYSVITLEDVLNGNYNDEDIRNMNLSEKYATSIDLLKCEKKDLDIVRDFVKKLSVEVLATFDVLYNYKNDKKEIIQNQNNKR